MMTALHTAQLVKSTKALRYFVQTLFILSSTDAPVVTTQPIIVADISTQVNMTCLVDANPQTTSVRWEKIDGDSINGNGPNFVFYAEKRYIGNYSCTARNLLQPSGQGDKHVTSKGYTTLRINCKYSKTCLKRPL